MKLIAIDGSMGESGGQVLRTALTMALGTGQPVRIDNIRAKRPAPGLLPQHLTAVRAAASISGARVDGAEIRSPALEFTPRAVTGGDYTFDVGRADSATLVMQTVIGPLLLAGAPSTVTLEGVTHGPWAPPFEFIDRVLLPIINRLGARVTAALDRRGFFPAGGGRFTVKVEPVTRLARLDLLERGEIRERKAKVIVANLPRHIAERELDTVMKLLNWADDCGSIEEVNDATGPGNVVFVETIAEHATEICTCVSPTRTWAEGVRVAPVLDVPLIVAKMAAKHMQRYLSAGVPVGLHLADQLMPILALGTGGSYRTLSLSGHALTNADVIRQFSGVSIKTTNETHDVVRVDVERQ